MKNPETNRYGILLFCLLLMSACQNPKQPGVQEKDQKQDYVYEPQKGALRIVSTVTNPEIKRVTLFRDNEKDSVTSVVPESGKFTLSAEDIAANEVYFLKLTGVSAKQGTSGLSWEERVPVLALPSGELELTQQAFNHAGSISKVKFSVQGGGDEQQLLNDWQTALVELQAEEDGKMEHFTLKPSGATKVAGKQGSSRNPASVTQDFIREQKPLISSLYLISRYGKHRQYAKDYQAILDKSTDPVKSSKYGLDLARHLDRIQTKVQQLDLEKQVVATDARLAEIPWDSFKDRKYLLLSFWNSSNQSAVKAMQELKSAAPELESKGIDVVLISMESQLSTWRDASKDLNFKYNYKMRNEAQQDLIDTLYLSELPRLVLVTPDGEVIDDDLSLGQVKELE